MATQDDTLTGAVPDPDVEPTPAELAHARRFAELVDKSLAGRPPPAMSADDRTLLEVATVIRATQGSAPLGESEQRAIVEEALKSGRLPAVVATSSLELGIDMGAVDLVVQVESPRSVARGMQRIGRAGHQVGAPSRGRVFPKYRGDLLECAAVVERMRRADTDGRAAEEGMAIAREIAAEIRPLVQGVQITTAPRAIDMALGLIEAFLAPVQAKGI